LPLIVEFENPRIERDQLDFRRRAALAQRIGIAALADRSPLAVATVDELAVEVAQIDAQPALAEIIVRGRRRLEIGELENAFIHRGDADEARLPGTEALDLEWQVDGLARGHIRWQIEGDLQAALSRIEAEPGNADGAPRPVLAFAARP